MNPKTEPATRTVRLSLDEARVLVADLRNARTAESYVYVDESANATGIVEMRTLDVEPTIKRFASNRRRLLVDLRKQVGLQHTLTAFRIIQYQRIERALILSGIRSAFNWLSLSGDTARQAAVSAYEAAVSDICDAVVETEMGISTNRQGADSRHIAAYLAERITAYNEMPFTVRRTRIVDALDDSHRVDVLTFSGRARPYISNETLNLANVRTCYVYGGDRTVTERDVKRIKRETERKDKITQKLALAVNVPAIAESVRGYVEPLAVDRVSDLDVDAVTIADRRSRLANPNIRNIELARFDKPIEPATQLRILKWIADRRKADSVAKRRRVDALIDVANRNATRKARRVLENARRSISDAFAPTREPQVVGSRVNP